MQEQDKDKLQDEEILDAEVLFGQAATTEQKRHLENIQNHEPTEKKPNKLMLAVCAAVVVLAVGGAVFGFLRGKNKTDGDTSAAQTQATDHVFDGVPIAAEKNDADAKKTDDQSAKPDKQTDTDISAENVTALSEDGEEQIHPLERTEGAFVYLKNNALYYRDVNQDAPICLAEGWVLPPSSELNNDYFQDMYENFNYNSADMSSEAMSDWITILPDGSGIFYPLQLRFDVIIGNWDVNTEGATIVYRSLADPDEPLRILGTDIAAYTILPDNSGAVYAKNAKNHPGYYIEFSICWTNFRTTTVLQEQAWNFMISKKGDRILIRDSDANQSMVRLEQLSKDGTPPNPILEFETINTLDTLYANDDFSELTYLVQSDGAGYDVVRWREGSGAQTVVSGAHLISQCDLFFCDDGTFYWMNPANLTMNKEDNTGTYDLNAPVGGYEDISEIKPDPTDDILLACEMVGSMAWVDDEWAEYDKDRFTNAPDWEEVKRRDKIRRTLRNTVAASNSMADNCLWYFNGETNVLISQTSVTSVFGLGFDEKGHFWFGEQAESVQKLTMTDLLEAVDGVEYANIDGKITEFFYSYTAEQVNKASQLVLVDKGRRITIPDADVATSGTFYFDEEYGKIVLFSSSQEAYVNWDNADYWRNWSLSYVDPTTFALTPVGDNVTHNSAMVWMGGGYYCISAGEYKETLCKDGTPLFDFYCGLQQYMNGEYTLYQYGDDEFFFLSDAEASDEKGTVGTLCLYENGTIVELAERVCLFNVSHDTLPYYISNTDSVKQSGELHWRSVEKDVLLDTDVTCVMQFTLESVSEQNVGTPIHGALIFRYY